MKCIYCTHKKTEVVNSREADGGFSTWRRRHCISCGKVFTTTESGALTIYLLSSLIRDAKGFMYEKLFVSIFSVFASMKGHDNGDDATISKSVAEEVLNKIHTKINRKDVRTSEIIVFVFRELKKIDKAIAHKYIYYSDYRRKVGVELSLI